MSSLSLSDTSGFLRPQTHAHNVQCSGAGDCMTLFPHWKDSSKPYQGRRGAGCWTRSLLSCEGIPCWTCRNSSRFSCAPVLMKEEQCGQTGPATLPILTFSSQKLDASDWFFAGFSLPAWVSHSAPGWWYCATSGWAPEPLPTCRAHRCLQAGQALVSRRCKPCLVLSCTSLSPG